METKFKYYLVIQGNYGYGWEDVSQYEATSTRKAKEYTKTKEGKIIPLYRADLKEYNFSGYGAHRVIFRKEKNN